MLYLQPERLTWFVAQVLQEVSELMDGALEEMEEEEESKEEERKEVEEEEGEEVLQWEEKEVNAPWTHSWREHSHV